MPRRPDFDPGATDSGIPENVLVLHRERRVLAWDDPGGRPGQTAALPCDATEDQDHFVGDGRGLAARASGSSLRPFAEFVQSDFVVGSFPFEIGDVVLLYTDGIIETRDSAGAFCPLAVRMAS